MMHIVVRAPIEIKAGPAGTRRIIENVSAQIKGQDASLGAVQQVGGEETLLRPAALLAGILRYM